MSKKWIIFIIILLMTHSVLAATIHGTIYSFDLEKRNNAIANIDSTPPQTIVANDGTYRFELNPGKYTLTASFSEQGLKESVTENIKIDQQGSYVLDLILFPSFEDEDELMKVVSNPIIDDNTLKQGTSTLTLIIFIISIIGFALITYFVIKYKKMLSEVSKEVEKTNQELKKNKISEMDKENKDVIDFIKSKGGRITQKEIRRNFPSSEAKISLIISELEEKNIVKKIKKGRGNIIVLK